MSNASPSRLGMINNAGDARALFLKVFPGEVQKAFNNANVALNRHLIRTISSGKSAQFPGMGTTTSAYHTPGTELLGDDLVRHYEEVINIDALCVSNIFVANIDEAMNHYQVRGEYASQMGIALSNLADRQVLQVGVLGARESAPYTGGNGGSTLVNAGFSTSGSTLASGLFSAAQTFDEKNVPDMDRNAFFRPAQYYALSQETNNINRDWGGSGSFKDGTIFQVAGINILKTNQLPITDMSGDDDTGHENVYIDDFSTTIGLVTHKAGIGTVKLLDLMMEQEYLITHQGTLMVAKYAMGHKHLRPDCLIELATA